MPAHNKCCACGYEWFAGSGMNGQKNRYGELVAPCCRSKYWEWLDY